MYIYQKHIKKCGEGECEERGETKTSHDVESIRKTFKIFNLTTANATIGKLTKIMYLHTS